MDDWFSSKQGWERYAGDVDRRCYPNSHGREVHIWASQDKHGEPVVVAGLATFGRLRISEMIEFLKVLYNQSDFVLLEARGAFFEAEKGGQLLDFDSSVRTTQDKNIRLDPADEQVVADGHYMWFGRQGRRLTRGVPQKIEWLISSRVITAQGSVNASGTATPNRDDYIRHKRRDLDGRCRVTGKLALDRSKPRGKDWSALHSAHVFPFGWTRTVEWKIAQMFSKEAFKKVKELGLLTKDLTENTILMDARAHAWFDDYRFGIWPVEEKGKWYGKIFRFEQGRCEVDGEWLLAASRPAKYPHPAPGQPETDEQREARKTDEKEREEDKTRCDLTDDTVLRELLKVHFQTCLHWHVKGMGWAK